MKVYIVVCDAVVSQVGYPTLEKAQAFIESRSDKPECLTVVGGIKGWSYISDRHAYYIREVSIND